MKTQLFLLLILAFVVSTSVSAQKTDRQKKKIEQNAGKEKQVGELVNSKNFVFTAQWAFPIGHKAIDLTTNPNFVEFKPEMVECSMPFFGRGYNIAYGGEAGIKFKGEPLLFTVGKYKKGYLVETKVKGSNDLFLITLRIDPSGKASMSISSNNRSAISYDGEITAPEITDKDQ